MKKQSLKKISLIRHGELSALFRNGGIKIPLSLFIKGGTIIILMFFASQKILADTHYVNVNSVSPTSPYTNWATAANTIQDGIDAASSYDTVLVTNGIYTLGGAATPSYSLFNRVVITKPMTVRSINGPESTVIYGQGPVGVGATRCLYLVKGELIGFCLSNGHTLATGNNDFERSGGGALIGVSGIISNCTITSCAADYNGGGIIRFGS